MRLGDYADGAWMFIATCDTCGRQTRVDPAEVLTHPRTHPHMRVAELALRLRCRDCRHRTAWIDPVARLSHAGVCRRDDLTRRRGTRTRASRCCCMNDLLWVVRFGPSFSPPQESHYRDEVEGSSHG